MIEINTTGHEGGCCLSGDCRDWPEGFILGPYGAEFKPNIVNLC